MDESKAPAKPDQKPESIRGWYERTTKRSRRVLAIMTVISLSIMTAMLIYAPLPLLARLQTGNGALTIPLVGALWIFAFIFMFLVPSREASFRAQESLEEGLGLLREAIDTHLKPAAEVWQRIGLQVEKEYPEIKKKVEESILDLKKMSERVQKAVDDNGNFVSEAKPVLETLKRIEERIEEDLLDDVQLMAEAVKRMSGMPPVSAPKAASAPSATAQEVSSEVPLVPGAIPPAREPSLGVALSSIRKRKEAASVQPK